MWTDCDLVYIFQMQYSQLLHISIHLSKTVVSRTACPPMRVLLLERQTCQGGQAGRENNADSSQKRQKKVIQGKKGRKKQKNHEVNVQGIQQGQVQRQEAYKILCFLLPVILIHKTLKEIQYFLDSIYLIHNIELKNNSPEF